MFNQQSASSSERSFEELLNEYFEAKPKLENTVVQGKIIRIDNEKEIAIVDVGFKSEGRVQLKDIHSEAKEGDTIDVFVERLEDKNGEVVLSIEKAKREVSWKEMEQHHKDGVHVNGKIYGRVKGGFTVELKDNIIAFLPGSQVDVRPIRDISPLFGIEQPFAILKMDQKKNNIVVSRRAILEESRSEERTRLVAELSEGQELEGIVKNITEYGAFVDLGGVDGLLHVTDISWRRVNHPNEVLQIGQKVPVKVIRFQPETQRISLGMKQLTEDPWSRMAEQNIVLGQKVAGKVTKISDFGVFVELGTGIEGLIHVSEMSWTKKNVHPPKMFQVGQEVEVMGMEIDTAKRRISLGLKQCCPNPWQDFKEKHPEGTEFEGEIKNITEFGLFVGVRDDLDGMVHITDLSWDKPGEEAIKEYKLGQKVLVKVLSVDHTKERISLGIKQLGPDSFKENCKGIEAGSIIDFQVEKQLDSGLEVSIADGKMTAFIKKSELSQREQLKVGDVSKARVMFVDSNSRSIGLSVRKMELEEDQKNIKAYADKGQIGNDALKDALKSISDN